MKIITKQMNERMNSFIQNTPEDYIQNVVIPTNEPNETNIKQKKVLKKTDGLIERIDNKMFITEDNRQLLQD